MITVTISDPASRVQEALDVTLTFGRFEIRPLADGRTEIITEWPLNLFAIGRTMGVLQMSNAWSLSDDINSKGK